MSEHREALERIMAQCVNSRQYTRRIQAIHDIAMRALGLTQSQREDRHQRGEENALQYQADRAKNIRKNHANDQ